MTASSWIILRMGNVSGKSCRENQNTHFIFNSIFLENCAVYEIMWKNTVEPDRPQMTVRRMPLYAGYLRINTHTQNMQYLFLFYLNSGYANAPHCYLYAYIVVRTPLWWIITRRVVVISYGRFGATYQFHLQGSRWDLFNYNVHADRSLDPSIHSYNILCFLKLIKYCNMRLNNNEFRGELEACFPTARISKSTYLLVLYA